MQRDSEYRDDRYEALGSPIVRRCNIVIFSKDRAAQLDLLLSSMVENIKNLATDASVTVIFKASSREFQMGYQKLVKKWGRQDKDTGLVLWKNQDQMANFKSSIEDNINLSLPMTMFLVDDIVFTRPFSFDDAEVRHFLGNEDVLALSLRLDPHKTYCYALNQNMEPPPSQREDMLLYSWHGQDGDFGYPMSVDGNIFRTSDIAHHIFATNYWNPNTFEARLSENPIKRPQLLAYNKAKLFNIPANITQDTFSNRHGNHEENQLQIMNNRFLAGEHIDLSPFRGMDTHSVHFETDYVWINESEEL